MADPPPRNAYRLRDVKRSGAFVFGEEGHDRLLVRLRALAAYSGNVSRRIARNRFARIGRKRQQHRGDLGESGLPPDLGKGASSERRRNPPFDFTEFGIAEGAVLEFYDARAGKPRPEVTATVCGPKEIRYKGKATSMSAVAKRLMKLKSAPRGTEYWTYNGRRLIDIYREKYPLP